MNITSEQKSKCLDILSKITHAKSPADYEVQVDNLSSFDSVYKYFQSNWGKIKEEWVSCFKNKDFNIGETTNNRLESFNSKIKDVCSSYGSIKQFFSDLFSLLGALRNERRHCQIMALVRKPIRFESQPEELQQWVSFVTPYAFEHILN